MNSISFCITTSKNEKHYTFDLLKSLEKHTDFNKHEVLILIDSDNQNTYEDLLKYKKDKSNIRVYKNQSGFPIGYQRNISILFDKASHDIVMYLQADMVVGPDFDKYFLEALNNDPKRIISAARIEPPLHPASPEKIIKNFGLNPEEFDFEAFSNFARDLQKENRPLIYGYFAPFGLYKDSYFKYMGGFDSQFRCSREDSDFIIRLHNNLDALQSWNACVYHYSCVSSRGDEWYKQTLLSDIKNQWQIKADHEELKRFIRKWGYFGHDYRPKYQTSLILDINTAPNLLLFSQIEPYFDKIILNEKPVLEELISLTTFESHYYANKRWGYTPEYWDKVKHKFMGPNLKNKFILLENYDYNDDVIIKTDLYSLHNNFKLEEVQQFIQNYNSTLYSLSNSSPEDYKGKYQINCFEIEIKNLSDKNKNHLDSKQYLFDTSEFIFN